MAQSEELTLATPKSHAQTNTMAPSKGTLDATREFESQALPHMPLMLSMARRLGLGEEDAQDLVQETFIKAFKSWKQFEQGTNLRAWLLKIMHTNLNNAEKRKRDKAKGSIDELEDWQVGTATSLTAMASRSAELEAIDNMPPSIIREAIDALPKNQRDVLLQVVVAGLPYKDVAENLGIPQGTVMSSLNRAKSKLKKKLEEYALAEGYNITGGAGE
jgi:RNA polymerase sigma-70 factor (ECF subfamily)